MIKYIKRRFRNILDRYFDSLNREEILLIYNQSSYSDFIHNEIVGRVRFYFGNECIDKLKIIKVTYSQMILYFLFTRKIKLLFGFELPNNIQRDIHHFKFFNIDFNLNPDDGWRWHDAITCFEKSHEDVKQDVRSSYEKYNNFLSTLPSLDRAYIFGTGPSLANAINMDWSNGYRIVCNTIVKDGELWGHINPHVIVAGDAIYHFGHNNFALSFISDLRERLSESSTVFIYPYMYHVYVSRVLSSYLDRLIPIPTDTFAEIHGELKSKFILPAKIGNILNLLLLPIGANLSKNVYLFGFDGRAPNDKLFWSNSEKHTYKDKMLEIMKSHPKFFEYHVPYSNQNQYVEKVHGEALDTILTIAEAKGWTFKMMHKSWTPTLQKRFNN